MELSDDANGDGKDDLILFARRQGKACVALSTGVQCYPVLSHKTHVEDNALWAEAVAQLLGAATTCRLLSLP